MPNANPVMQVQNRFQEFDDSNIRGAFFKAYSEYNNNLILPKLALVTPSSRAVEIYKWLGSAPKMRVYDGETKFEQFNKFEWFIANVLYEGAFEFHLLEMLRDQTGHIEISASELGEAAALNPAEVLTELMKNAETQACYDSRPYFDTQHPIAKGSTTYNVNKITKTVTSLTNVTVQEAADAIYDGITQILSMKDDRGRTINKGSKDFVVVAPLKLAKVINAAVNNELINGGETNTLKRSKYTVSVEIDPDLDSAFTNKFDVYKTDGRVRPYIHQVELVIPPKAIHKESDYKYEFKTLRSEGIGFGDYRKACRVTLST